MTTTDELTLALVIITGAYTLGTFLILRANNASVAAMRDQIDAQTRPYVMVSVFLRTGTNVLYMRVKNVGQTGANHLQLQLDKDFYQNGERHDGRNLAKHVAFTSEIACLPPDGELLFLLGTGPAIFGPQAVPDVVPKIFTVSASYQYGQREATESTVVDLRPYIGTDVPHDPIVEELERIRRSIDDLKRSVDQVSRGG